MELTENAAAALENIRESQGVPEESGTRITAEKDASGSLALRLEFVDEVSADDRLVEQAGTEVYLDPVVVEPLENTIMDVQDQGDGLAFVFRGQSS